MDIGFMSWLGRLDGWLNRVVMNHAYVDEAGRVIDLNRI